MLNNPAVLWLLRTKSENLNITSPNTKYQRHTRQLGGQSILQCSWLRKGVPLAATSHRFEASYCIHNTMKSVWIDLCAIWTNKPPAFVQRFMETCLWDFRDNFLPHTDIVFINSKSFKDHSNQIRLTLRQLK